MALDKLTQSTTLKQWRERINQVIDELDKRAPINHAINDTKYGVGNSSEYGHVKLIDDMNAVYDSTSGIAATPIAVKGVYDIAKNALQKDTPIAGIVKAEGFVGNLEGNATSATSAISATNDGVGNNIAQTYATKNEVINGLVYSGSLKKAGTAIQWRDILTDKGINSSFIYQTTYKGYMPALNLQTQDGRVGFGTRDDFCRWDYFKTSNDTNIPNSYIDLSPTDATVMANLNVLGSSCKIGSVTDKIVSNLDVNGYIFANGDITGDRVYNAEWNDYAEFFERGGDTEVGDIISLDLSSDEERYVKASKENPTIVGVHSDTYGHILGGKDSIKESEETHIPVGLVGRVKTKIVGKIKKGEYVVLSGIPGVGCAYDEKLNNPLDVFGVAVESSDDIDIKLVKIKLK